MKWPVFSLDGTEDHTIDLNEAIFSCKVNHALIYYAIRNELMNRRVGTASTKSRGAVIGSQRKPWRQKGTGRARAGSRKSPIWVGGGTVFGPHLRDYSYRMPRQQKRRAMYSLLSLLTKENRLRIVMDFDIESGKTKELIQTIGKVAQPVRSVIILGKEDQMLKRAASNISWLTYLNYNRLCVHELFYSNQILIQESAVKVLTQHHVEGLVS